MHSLRFGGSVMRHTTGGTGSEPGTAMLGTFTFLSTTTAPFDQLTLADVQQYTQPVSYGVTSYELSQWLSVAFVAGQHPRRRPVHPRCRAPLRPPDADRRDEQLRAAPRLRLASAGRRAAGGSRRLRDVLHADPRQRAGERADGRPRRPGDLFSHAGADRLPHLPDRPLPACPDRSADAAAVAAAGAQHHDPRRRRATSIAASSRATGSTSTCCRTIPTSS